MRILRNRHLWSMVATAGAALALTLAVAGSAEARFQVTAVSLEADPKVYEGPCPVTIKFTGKITANMPGTVKYTFTRNDGASAPVRNLSIGGGFAPAGEGVTGTVHNTWQLGGPGLPAYTGWQTLKILSPNPMESNKAGFKIRCTNGPGEGKGPSIKPGTRLPLSEAVKPGIKPGTGVLGSCPDPAAHRIDFSIVQRTSQFAGRVKIVGVAKNVGGAAYESGSNQQQIHLYEHIPGGSPRLVAREPFHNLAPGQEATVQYERAWDSSSPAEGEFPPTYKLQIVYDPDIRLDSNPKNDDCRGANNQKERSGADINALFR